MRVTAQKYVSLHQTQLCCGGAAKHTKHTNSGIGSSFCSSCSCSGGSNSSSNDHVVQSLPISVQLEAARRGRQREMGRRETRRWTACEPFKTPARQRQTIPRLACLDTVFGMNAVLDSLSFNSLNLVFSSSFSASLPLEVMLVVASWGDRPTHGRQCENRSWPLRTQHHSRECPIEILSFDTGRRVRHRFA